MQIAQIERFFIDFHQTNTTDSYSEQKSQLGQS